MLTTIFACFMGALTSLAVMVFRSTRQHAHHSAVAQSRRSKITRR